MKKIILILLFVILLSGCNSESGTMKSMEVLNKKFYELYNSEAYVFTISDTETTSTLYMNADGTYAVDTVISGDTKMEWSESCGINGVYALVIDGERLDYSSETVKSEHCVADLEYFTGTFQYIDDMTFF
ncbi:MAG: lipoprotein, partial [Erysipelotrichaceae bacterium]